MSVPINPKVGVNRVTHYIFMCFPITPFYGAIRDLIIVFKKIIT